MKFFLSLFAFSFLFSGCGNFSLPEKISNPLSEEISSNPSDSTTEDTDLLKNLVLQERLNKEKISAGISLEKISEDEKTITLEIIISNPTQEKIQSVQSWITYPTKILQEGNIEILSQEIFDLTAPGEKNFDRQSGMVKIGVSVGGKAKKTPKIFPLARITFLKKSASPFHLQFFDVNQTGHTRIMSMTKTGIRNILNSEKVTEFISEE